MTKQEWIKKRFIQSDLDYLVKCGFEVSVEENDNRYYPDQEYMVVITADNFSERIHNMRHLEVIVDVIKQYKRMSRGKK